MSVNTDDGLKDGLVQLDIAGFKYTVESSTLYNCPTLFVMVEQLLREKGKNAFCEEIWLGKIVSIYSTLFENRWTETSKRPRWYCEAGRGSILLWCNNDAIIETKLATKDNEKKHIGGNWRFPASILEGTTYIRSSFNVSFIRCQWRRLKVAYFKDKKTDFGLQGFQFSFVLFRYAWLEFFACGRKCWTNKKINFKFSIFNSRKHILRFFLEKVPTCDRGHIFAIFLGKSAKIW